MDAATAGQGPSPQEKAFNTAERKSRSEKKQLKGKVLMGLFVALAVIYFGDAWKLDDALYFVVGGIDSVTPGNDWLPGFKGGLGTFKWMGFLVCAGAGVYLAKQES